MTTDLLWALALGLTGAIAFAAIGLVSGTDETSTLGPLTLLVVLLGVPPAGVITFFVPDILRGTPAMNGSARGTGLVVLAVVPILLTAMIVVVSLVQGRIFGFGRSTASA